MKAQQVTQENYFQKEIRNKYLSNSVIKDFIGCPAKQGCPARAMATLKREWEPKKTDAFLVGSYVDSYFEGTLMEFKLNNPQIFKKDGTLYAQFKKAEEIIQVAEKDKLFMKFMSGKKQEIYTGNIDGIEYIGKLDIEHDELIVDLKIMKDIGPVWDDEAKRKVNFIRAWGIDKQLALYRELVRLNTGKTKDCYIAVLTKETITDKEIVYIPHEVLDLAFDELRMQSKTVVRYKSGELKATRCGNCDYCKSTKVLTNPISFFDLKPFEDRSFY